jgi:protein-S-isoprenylcysteine O-methyltransferase Ste14
VPVARRGGTWVQRWRVPLGFVCAAVFIVLAKPDRRSLLIGGAVALVGLAIRAWASGHIRKNARLAVSGPYAHTRNPLYLGSFILGLGFTVAASSSLLLLLVLGGLFASLFLGIYWPVMRVEASTLAEMFGEEYKRYAAAVPLLLPRLTPYRAGEDSAVRFDPSLYLRYREYRAALGLLVAWCVLWLKAVLAF